MTSLSAPILSPAQDSSCIDLQLTIQGVFVLDHYLKNCKIITLFFAGFIRPAEWCLVCRGIRRARQQWNCNVPPDEAYACLGTLSP